MLNIIIYENDNNYMSKNIDCINKAFANHNIDYRIRKFTSYTNELDKIVKEKQTRKIYILDVEVPEISGLELAARIREHDWDSIIIFATAYDKYKNDVFYIRLMVLDFVCKYQGYEERLIEDIKIASSIIDKNHNFVFSYNHTTYRIPYNQICYIEKEPIIKRCIIHTYTNDYCITGTLNGLMEKLEGNFVRTHQSCIVNADNVKEIDFSSNVITFGHGISTDMLTNHTKKELSERVRRN